MSITEFKKDQIFYYILKHVDQDDSKLVAKTSENFEISRTTVYNYLKKLVANNDIQAYERAQCRYKLINDDNIFEFSTEKHLEEDIIFRQYISPIIKNYPQNVFALWNYIFTEMMNNAIEHAQANKITVLVSTNKLYTEIVISDDGIGIFENIKQFFSHQGTEITLDEAVDTLFPGKFTTASDHHSGQGIFFSSRAADFFVISSSNKTFTHDNFEDKRFNFPEGFTGDKGTSVLIRLSNNTSKTPKEVFDMYSDTERGFFRTQIPIAHMFSNYPVSRSEARRLGALISNFEEANLDFSNVSDIGQAFTHELFVVFQGNNPKIKLNFMNANDTVSTMINRVINTK